MNTKNVTIPTELKVDRYLYRVSEHVLIPFFDPKNCEPYYHDQNFQDGDIMQSRRDAWLYYVRRGDKLRRGEFPMANRFRGEKNAVFTLSLSLVIQYNGDPNAEDEYFLAGSDMMDVEEGRELEKMILNKIIIARN